MRSKTDVLKAYARLEALLNAQITTGSPWSRDHNLKLERISALVDGLGSPQFAYPTVHVGGTSGKGTVAALTASLLSAHGSRTGLHLSPFVECLTETWQIDGKYLDPNAVLEAVRIVLAAEPSPVSETYGPPSYFEVKVASAFVAFERAHVDVAVIEVGLGGALDATNVLGAGVKVLTNVSLDHTDVLGNTVEEIAADKVQIVKPGSAVVSDVTQASVREILRCRVADVKARLYLLDDNVKVSAANGNLTVEMLGTVISVAIPAMWPAYQVRNAALALTAAQLQLGTIDADLAASALASVALPGRFEVISAAPTIILDGAHNPEKLAALITRLRSEYPNRRYVGILAVKKGKDVNALVDLAARSFSHVVLTTFDAEPWEPVSPHALADAFKAVYFTGEIVVQPDPESALDAGLALCEDAAILVVSGSLYLVGNVRRRWRPLVDEIAEGRSYVVGRQ